jgi:uncharacterized protein (DUF58 family)
MAALDRKPGGRQTSLAQPLRRVAEMARKRGLIILLTDLLAPLEELETNLGRLASAGHELALFHILDPNEVLFQFDRPALFQDLESQQDVYVDPASLRADYQARMAAHCAQAETLCRKLGAAFHRIVTYQPLEIALAEFLRARSRRNKLVRRRVRSSAST